MHIQPFDGAPPPRIVDLVDTHAKFIDNLASKKLSYVQQLELAAPGSRLPPNSKPSLLQTKLKGGSNRYRIKMTYPSASTICDAYRI